MTVEHGSSAKVRNSSEHGGGLSDVQKTAESILDAVADGEQPRGIVFADVAVSDPVVGSSVLELICELTGSEPQSAGEIAALFDFKSAGEVEEFFRLLGS